MIAIAQSIRHILADKPGLAVDLHNPDGTEFCVGESQDVFSHIFHINIGGFENAESEMYLMGYV